MPDPFSHSALLGLVDAVSEFPLALWTGHLAAWFDRSTDAVSWSSPLLAGLARWGYAGLALVVLLESAGIPVPGETALLAAAFGAAHGVLALPWIIAVAIASSVSGDNLGFAIGRRVGRRWVERPGRRVLMTPERLARVDAFFARFGPSAVALARFVAGVRVVAAFAAGMSNMPWPVFFRYNVLGAIAWATLVSLAGYTLGRGYAGVASGIGRAGATLAVVIPVILFAAWLLTWFRRHVAQRPATADFVGTPEPLLRTLSGRASAAATDLQAWVSQLALRWLVVLGVSAAAVLTFAAIAEEVSERETAWVDDTVRAFALAHTSPAAHAAFNALTWTGSSLVLGPLAVAVALWLWRRAGRRAAAVTALVPVAAVLLILGLKAVFHRARPGGAEQYAHLGYSFPSGHSTGSMAIALTLAYVLARRGLAPRWLIAAAVTFSLLVGMSRIYLDLHWATDVVGGWALGLTVAAACAALYEWLEARERAHIAARER